MLFISILFFIFSVAQCPYVSACDQDDQMQPDFKVQAGCMLARMPQSVLDTIMLRLPHYSDLAHVRQTCRFFNRTFLNNRIKLSNIKRAKEDSTFWETLSKKLAQCINAVYLKKGMVIVDLTGCRVTEFMFAKHAECQHVKKLRLVDCNITMERENFFDKSSWTNLEKLNLRKNFLGLRDGDLSKSADWYSGADIWPSLCGLPKLKVLILSENNLRKMRQEIFQCQHLRLLDLRCNYLEQNTLTELEMRLPTTMILFHPQLTIN